MIQYAATRCEVTKEPDKLFAYRGVDWHAHRKAGRLQFYCAVVGCKNKPGEFYLDRRLLNSHRREKHGELQLPDVILKELNRKTKYSRERYERERNDRRKWLDNCSRSQRWKLEHKACSKEGVTDKSKLSDITKAEIDEKMAVYDNEENRQKRIRTRDEREATNSYNPAQVQIEREEAMSEREEEKLVRERNKVETEERTLEMDAEKEELGREQQPVETERAETEKDSTSTELAPLSKEEEAQVNDALTGSNSNKVLVFHRKSNMKITKDDIHCLLPRRWLNSQVINLYLVLLKDRQEREPTRHIKCHFFDTWFYSTVVNVNGGGYNYNELIKLTEGLELQTFDSVLVLIHCGHHWSLGVINFRKNKIQYFDSLNQKGDDVYNMLMTFLKDEARKKHWNLDIVDGLEFENVKQIPLQENLDDCGVYMLLYADFHSRGWKPKFNQNDIPKYRRIMVNDILRLRVGDYFRNEGREDSATRQDVLHVDEDSSAGTSRPPLQHMGLTPTLIKKVKSGRERKEKKAA